MKEDHGGGGGCQRGIYYAFTKRARGNYSGPAFENTATHLSVKAEMYTDRRCNYASARNKGSPRVVLINAKFALNIHAGGG